MAALLRHDGPWADAITRHAAAAQAAQRLGDRLAQANALLDLGVVQHETGQYPDAAGSLQAARAIYRDLGDLLGQANVIRELGVIGQAGPGQYPDAADVLEEALSIYRDVGDALGQGERRGVAGAHALLSEGVPGCYRRPGDGAGHLRAPRRPARPGRALWRLGQVRLWTGDYRRAAELMEAGLGISRDLGDGLNQARALRTTGSAALQDRGLPERGRGAGGCSGALPASPPARPRPGPRPMGMASRRQLTGDHRDAVGGPYPALAIDRDLGALHNQADTLTSLGTIRRLTGGRPGRRPGTAGSTGPLPPPRRPAMSR